MKIIDQYWEWEQKPENVLKTIEKAGRTCYKSEDKITEDSARKFVQMIVNNGHHSVLEHVIASIRLITNRGVTHELVRHRLASYSQESTRFIKHNDIHFIRPVWIEKKELLKEAAKMQSDIVIWINHMQECEKNYMHLIDLGWRPEQARGVLPIDLKTEIVVTANVREWRHMFNMRASIKAHPQIRALFKDILVAFKQEIPIIFDNI